jgi:hypothetical protein
MATNDFWSESGRLLRDQINQAINLFTTQAAHLNASELRALDALSADLWSFIYAERYPSMATSADSPIWTAISQVGINIYPQTVSFRGREVTLWAWSIPELHIAMGEDAGKVTQIDALRGALFLFSITLRLAQQEQQAMLKADLATFQAWKALKQQAGTWMYPYNPTHPDEQGANTREGFTTEDGRGPLV